MKPKQRIAEAASLISSILLAKESDVSFSTRTNILNVALCDSDFCPHGEEDYCSCWVLDVFDTYFVFRTQGETFRLDYTINADNSVTFGAAAVPVIPVMTYPDAPVEPPDSGLDEGKRKKKRSKGSPFNESVVELVGDVQPIALALTEAALAESATAMVKLIAPGWGSSGYYSPTVLQKAAAVFRKGMQMFIDHPTATEEAARPEGRIEDLGGELMEDAKWREDLPSGPGLYASARIFDRFKSSLRDLKDSIGVSIRAFGMTTPGEAEGRKGPLVSAITAGRSVDFVTVAGAGGKVVNMIESRRNAEKKESTMTAEEQARFDALTKANTDLQAQLATVTEATRGALAQVVVQRKLGDMKQLPEAARKRLGESLVGKAIFTAAGTVDETATGAMVEAAAADELRYIESVTGTGIVKGAGSTGQMRESATGAWSENDSKSFNAMIDQLRGRSNFEDDAAKGGRRQ